VFEIRLERVLDLGTAALGLGAWHAVGRTSGVELDGQGGAWLARMRDGRVIWWRTYTDQHEALASGGFAGEDAGLSSERPPLEVAATV
jgi:ketosteroid isomerase-like protein